MAIDKNLWEEKLKFYDELVSRNPNFKRKGKTMPYTSANGYMFSLFNKDGEIGIRLSKESGKRFMQEHETTIFKSHGAVMRGYVFIPEKLFPKLDLLDACLVEAFQYVRSLEPK
jgi:hypothetical protein